MAVRKFPKVALLGAICACLSKDVPQKSSNTCRASMTYFMLPSCTGKLCNLITPGRLGQSDGMFVTHNDYPEHVAFKVVVEAKASKVVVEAKASKVVVADKTPPRPMRQHCLETTMMTMFNHWPGLKRDSLQHDCLLRHSSVSQQCRSFFTDLMVQ